MESKLPPLGVGAEGAGAYRIPQGSVQYLVTKLVQREGTWRSLPPVAATG
jgi:hypothetical protein